MEQFKFEDITPLEAARRFHEGSPTGTESQAIAYADQFFSEKSDVQSFLTQWRKLRAFQASIRKAEYQNDVDRIWNEDKYG